MENYAKKTLAIFSDSEGQRPLSPASSQSLPMAFCNSIHSAFTIIELLVVIAIISMLISILIPMLMRAKLLAKNVACAARLKALGNAAALYQSDYDQYVPICFRNYDGNDSRISKPWQSWRVGLLPYTNGFETFNCPAAEGEGEIIHSKQELESQTQRAGTANMGSYGVIIQFALPTYKTYNFLGVKEVGSSATSLAFPTTPAVAWQNPENSVYVADAYLAKGPIESPTHSYNGHGTASIFRPSYSPSEYADFRYVTGFNYFDEVNPIRRFADRHLGTNCLFVGGHVESFVTSELESMQAGDSDCVWDVE